MCVVMSNFHEFRLNTDLHINTYIGDDTISNGNLDTREQYSINKIIGCTWINIRGGPSPACKYSPTIICEPNTFLEFGRQALEQIDDPMQCQFGSIDASIILN